MTRRATVWKKKGAGRTPRWIVDTCHKPDYRSDEDIELRCYLGEGSTSMPFGTYPEALAYALEQVGLAPHAAATRKEGA